MRSKILLIEDQDSFATAVDVMLEDHSVDVVRAENGAQGISAFRKCLHGYATVIIDYCLPDLKGSEVAQSIKRLNPSQDILFASGYGDSAFLIDLLETGGARSFLFKGRPIDDLRGRILESISIYHARNRVVGADEYSPSKAEIELREAGFIGRSFQLLSVLKKIHTYRESPFPTLIIGETGTGKEMIANALVPKGKRLVPVNCARYIQSENLLEAELFGFIKGAFTGATHDNAGLLAQAHGQVVFLDELHQLPLASQAKLLRFLQEMKFRRVGDNSGREISVQFRLVAATKPDIFERVRNGSFMEDLLHRVRPLVIRVPPLRERTDDIEPLVRHFQNKFNFGKSAQEHKQMRISTINEMIKQPWTGNVRQLINAVQQMFTDCASDIVSPSDFDAFLSNEGSPQPEEVRVSLEEATKQFEIERIVAALTGCRTQLEAATKLGIPLSTFNRKLGQLGIRPETFLSRNHKQRGII